MVSTDAFQAFMILVSILFLIIFVSKNIYELKTLA